MIHPGKPKTKNTVVAVKVVIAAATMVIDKMPGIIRHIGYLCFDGAYMITSI